MSSYYPAGAGVQGNIIDFPNIVSGAGGNSRYGTTENNIGGALAYGGGASGGGGALGGGNDSDHVSGSGGGGAGGSPDAGGGAGGISYNDYPTNRGGTASNHHTIPTSSTDHLGRTSNLGKGGMGQTDTQSATNGYNGWLYLESIKIGN